MAEIREEGPDAFASHGKISISFQIRSVLEVVDASAGRELRASAVPARTKDYDACAGDRPAELAKRFDVRNWRILSAWRDEQRVGGAILAWNTPGVDMLEGRHDLAVLWDLRVAPAHRGSGVGRAIWLASERWAARQGCTELKVETQDTNVPACRFYERMGCTLDEVVPHAYSEFPEETRLLWAKQLVPTTA